MEICSHCGGHTNGYKCKQCNQALLDKDPYHPCGREMIQPNCAACNKAEDNCACG